ncbi:MAG: hypothetical protein GX418_02025 [Clostridiales bacterium]|nr:hypothetical protein [Clostridiales bacterium]
MTENIFDRCRGIPAYQVAQQEGLEFRKRGERFWARCPFHADKTPSLVFFPDGGWKCFSCGAGGDAVSFLARLRGVPALVAATELAGQQPAHYTPRTQPSEYHKTQAVEQWRREKRMDLLDIQQDANEAMKRRVTALQEPDALMEDDSFTTALSAFWWAQNSIELLDRLTPESLYMQGLVI